MSPIILALCMAQSQGFADPFVVAQPVRLAITPELDGKLGSEEWDALSESGGCPSFMQWEPEAVYWAATAKEGQDVVVSMDMDADGWLIGGDNLEFRISMERGQPVLSLRRLDATDPAGPKWVAAKVLNESVLIAASQNADGWTVEGKFIPPAPESPEKGKRYGVRIDSVPTGSDLGTAYQPRAVSFVSLQYDFGQGLPTGFSWKPDFLVRNVPIDDSFKVKYGFKRTEAVEFEKLEFRAEGQAQPLMATGSKPFPNWDKKGHSGEQYTTNIGGGAPVGYHVLRLTLTDKDNGSTTLRSSFKISDLVDFDIRIPKSLKLDPEARIIRGSVNIRSNGLKRVNGEFTFKVPDEWTVTRGKQTDFIIYHSRGLSKVPLEFIVPKDTVGVFPLTFSAKIGERTVSKTLFVPVGES